MKDYPNITTYSEPTEVNIGKLDILFLPWINTENEKKTFELIKSTDCKHAMGHLGTNGFKSHRGHTMEDGMDCKLFEELSYVFSRGTTILDQMMEESSIWEIYEMFWNDVNDTRGFHIFDTESLELTPVNNPYKDVL